MKESMRCLKNAREILESAPIEDKRYAEVRPVRKACRKAYLAVLKAIDEYLLRKGLGKKELPKSMEAYREALQEHIAVRNRKLLKELESLYDALHIAGYHMGLICHATVVKRYMEAARQFIQEMERHEGGV